MIKTILLVSLVVMALVVIIQGQQVKAQLKVDEMFSAEELKNQANCKDN